MKITTISIGLVSMVFGVMAAGGMLIPPAPLTGETPAPLIAAAIATQPEEHPQPEKDSQQESIVPKYSKSAFDVTPLSRDAVARLAEGLDPEVYRITQKAGTEPAHCGTLLDNKKNGVYCCVVCGLPLFASEHKFTSGTGWPSFFTAFDPEHIVNKEDRSHGMVRTEIECARCGSHLGHVFEDGPKPTGLRYCLNSASLKFYEEGEERPAASLPIETETAYFAGGCFWGIEHYLEMGAGVINAESGYMQGAVENPSYEQICAGETDHAETVKVTFDPKVMSYARLLRAFFDMHDPTQVNRQGPDVGSQYRSGIWTTSTAQQTAAEAFVKELEASEKYDKPIATEIELAKVFYSAEDYHQDYIAKTGRACHVKNPW
ncbi:Peptide-methionine (R)-S-oxide reductase MsrB [hydrothermal vent metagenome]|uniref:Peptide-methionine (R)-S-oxide reductase MsrB n=1 Tax=hydrothermal vent metagenome TaxID=652676 RepID=A0A3B1DVZ7_9ZZZZ